MRTTGGEGLRRSLLQCGRMAYALISRYAVVLLVLLQWHIPARGQAADGAKVGPSAGAAFEVASMRLAPGNEELTSISPWGTRTFIAKNASGKLLLSLAFDIEGNQFAGLPGWADSTYYDVSAKAEGEAGLSYEQMKPMLQNLLRERLKLATHWTDTERSGYGLELRKGETGKKIEAGTGNAAGNLYILADGIRGNNVSMKMLAAMVASVMGRPVVDDTGLGGVYNIRLKFAPLTAADSSLPSLPSALEELGLSLKKRKVPVRMLTVDHMERMPLAN